MFGDETIIEAQALIGAFVKDEEAIKAATEATMDLAAAKGFDLVAAADLVSKTLGSSTNALSRYGIEVTGAVGSTERLESLTGNLANVFGGQASAQAETMSGKLAQMTNALGDAGEAFGSLLAPAVRMGADALSFLANSLTSIINLEETQKARLNDSVMAYTDLQKGLDDYNESVGNMTMDELIDEFFTLNKITNEQDKAFLREKALRGELRETIDQMTLSYSDLQIITSAQQETDEYGLTLQDKFIEQSEQIIDDIDRKSESIQAESEILDEYIKIKELQKEKDEAQIILEDKYILKMREKGEMLDTLTSKEKKTSRS